MLQKRMRKYLLTIMIMVIAFLAIPLPKSQAKSGDTVRVGYFYLPGFHEYNENGEPVGYDVDYLNKIAEYTGWQYRYVEIDSWVEAYEMLKRGRIDILAPAQTNAERQENFLVSAYPIGMEYGALLTRSDNDELVYEQYSSFDGLTIGCVETYVLRDEFRHLTYKHDFTPQMVYYHDTNELLEALNNHEVDAVVTNLAISLDGYKILSRFAPSSIFYMMNKSSTSLMEELNFALEKLNSENPEFEEDLTEKYFQSYKVIPFNSEELAYIEEAATIQVGIMGDRKPLSYTDSNGNLKGILIDIMNMISENTGIRFEYIPLSGEQIGYQDLLALNLDAVCGVERTKINTDIPGLHITKALFESDKVLVAKRGIRFNAEDAFVLATSTGSVTLPATLKDRYPNCIMEDYSSTKKALDAVKDGDAEMMIQSYYVAEDLLTKPQYKNLTVIPTTGLEEQLALAILIKNSAGEIRENLADERLISILNKGITALNEEDVNMSMIYYTAGMASTASFMDFLDAYKYFVIIIAVLLLGLIIIGIAVLRVHTKNLQIIKNSEQELNSLANKQKKMIDQLERMSRQDPLTGLLNKEAFKLRTEFYLNSIGQNIGGTMIFCDVDNFKMLNDTLGHLEGDKALVDIAEVIKSLFREEDYKGRFGGDEFVIFTPGIPEDILQQKIEELQRRLNLIYRSPETDTIVAISGSIGYVTVEEGEMDYDTIIEKADTALYRAKEKGKNCFVRYTEELERNF